MAALDVQIRNPRIRASGPLRDTDSIIPSRVAVQEEGSPRGSCKSLKTVDRRGQMGHLRAYDASVP